MARLRLTPQNREFYELYSQASRNAVEIARVLCRLLDAYPDDGAAMLEEITDLEHTGDRLTHEIVDLLNRTFVTPFERDDMYRLAGAIDDVCDDVDEAAHHLVNYGVTRVPMVARQQADVILRAAEHLERAVGRLEGFKDSKADLIALRTLEDEGDALLRTAIGDLFSTERDPISIIRWKDIHETLENATDALEKAADVLEAILVKNR
jgi:predicted phosphate transport protein (TIGR00153 family)